MRPASFGRRDEHFHKVVIVLTPNTPVTPADIERVLQSLFVFGSDIEQNRQTTFRRNAGQGSVERHLADRNSHPSGTLVAEAQDAFAVAHDNAFDPGVTGMGKDLVDHISVWIAQKKASRFTPDLTELLAGFAHGRGINDRQTFFDVVGDEGIEERFVAILEIPHEAVFLKRGGSVRPGPSCVVSVDLPAFRRGAAIVREGRKRPVRCR